MGGEEEAPNQQADDSIRVICRVRPLNKSEEAAGSKFVTSFPSSRGQEDQMVSVGVSTTSAFFSLTLWSANGLSLVKEKIIVLTYCTVRLHLQNNTLQRKWLVCGDRSKHYYFLH